MKYLIVKDKRKRNNAMKFQLKKLYLKSLFLEHFNFKNFFFTELKPNFILYYKFYNLCLIFNIKNLGALSLIKNRCVITGRAKSIIRYYKISRIIFREYVSYSSLIGVKKSSW